MTPKVSILIPAYNAERFVAAALESAVNQTWSSTEVILVDDGSKDQTLAISKRYECSKVKIISEEHHNAAATRNRALRECQGDFIQYLDADDLLSPDKIENQLLLLRDHPQHLSVPSAVYFFEGTLDSFSSNRSTSRRRSSVLAGAPQSHPCRSQASPHHSLSKPWLIHLQKAGWLRYSEKFYFRMHAPFA